jgi:hypothetical protein
MDRERREGQTRNGHKRWAGPNFNLPGLIRGKVHSTGSTIGFVWVLIINHKTIY